MRLNTPFERARTAVASLGYVELPNVEVVASTTFPNGTTRVTFAERDNAGQLQTLDAVIAEHCRTYYRATELRFGSLLSVRGKMELTPSGKLRLDVGFVTPNRTQRLGAIARGVSERDARLTAEGILHRQTQEPTKELLDKATRILVLRAHGAAGYSDFKAQLERIGRRAEVKPSHITLAASVRGRDNIVITTRKTSLGGETASPELLDTLRSPGHDLVLIMRGGGDWRGMSLFNDEVLLRAIRQCPVPVVLCVGHNTDSALLANRAGAGSFDTPTAAGRAIRDSFYRRHGTQIQPALAATRNPPAPTKSNLPRTQPGSVTDAQAARLKQELEQLQHTHAEIARQFAATVRIQQQAMTALSRRAFTRVESRSRLQATGALLATVALFVGAIMTGAPALLTVWATIGGVALAVWLLFGSWRARRPYPPKRHRRLCSEEWIEVAANASTPRAYRRLHQ